MLFHQCLCTSLIRNIFFLQIRSYRVICHKWGNFRIVSISQNIIFWHLLIIWSFYKKIMWPCLLTILFQSPEMLIDSHYLMKMEGPARTSRRRCLLCYKKTSRERGPKEARRNSKRVTTYCSGCPNLPFMCLDCYNEHHQS